LNEYKEVQGVKRLMPFVMADMNKCIGCKVCEVACHAWHHVQGNTAGAASGPVLPKVYVRRTAQGIIPVQCHQCEGAPCAKACTEGAIRFQEGRILIVAAKCKSCKDCVVACPFGAIKLVPADAKTPVGEPGGLEQHQFGNKCDLCFGRKQGPICVEACPENALYLIEPLKDKSKKNVKAAGSIVAIRRSGR
jgi:electron transport protein HydN